MFFLEKPSLFWILLSPINLSNQSKIHMKLNKNNLKEDYKIDKPENNKSKLIMVEEELKEAMEKANKTLWKIKLLKLLLLKNQM